MSPARSRPNARGEDAEHFSNLDRIIDLFEHDTCDCV
jgi:hypothetical protein